MTVRFTLNGEPQRCEVPAHWTLLRMLRDAALQTDPKHGCGEGVCGACAVFVDGVAVNSCSVLAPQVEGAAVCRPRWWRGAACSAASAPRGW